MEKYNYSFPLMSKNCTIASCLRSAKSKGLCTTHLAAEYSRKNPYSMFKRAAKQRGQAISITEEDYLNLRSRPCFYCDGPLPELGVGLDRLDRHQGYQLDNVVPCCGSCNWLREDRYTSEEVRFMVQQVKLFRAKKILG